MIRKTDYKVDKDYTPFGRKLMVVDDLRQKYVPAGEVEYEKRPTATAYTNGIYDMLNKVEEGSSVDLDQSTNHINESKYCTRSESEDTRIVKFIMDVALDMKTKVISQSGDLSVPVLNYAFAQIQTCGLEVKKVLMHPMQYADLRLFGCDLFDEATRRDMVEDGIFGHLWTANIHVSHRVPEGRVFLLAPAEDVGVLSVGYDDILEGISILDVNSIMMIDLTETAEEIENRRRHACKREIESIFKYNDSEDFQSWVKEFVKKDEEKENV